MKLGEPVHKQSAQAQVTFEHGEPTEVAVTVDYYVYTPRYDPEFEFTEAGKSRWGEELRGHLKDRLYNRIYQSGSPQSEYEDIVATLESDPREIQVVHNDTKYYIRVDDIRWDIIEGDGEFDDGITATFVFDVDDSGVGTLAHIRDIDGVVDDGVSIKVLRLWPAAAKQAISIPGVETVGDPVGVAGELIDEGDEAEWKGDIDG